MTSTQAPHRDRLPHRGPIPGQLAPRDFAADRHRARLLHAAALALLMLLALVVGFVVGRGTDTRAADSPPAVAPSRGGAPDRAPGADRDAVAAARAATTALLALSSRGYVTDPATRVRVLRQVATDADVAALSAELAQRVTPSADADPAAAAFAAPRLSAWRLVPLGYQVSGCSPTECTVRIWSVQITASTGRPPAAAAAAWGTSTLPMSWRDRGGWRLRVSAATATPGPTPPAVPTEATTSSDLEIVAADHHFTPYAPQPSPDRTQGTRAAGPVSVPEGR
jgi:hypothetical protein